MIGYEKDYPMFRAWDRIQSKYYTVYNGSTVVVGVEGIPYEMDSYCDLIEVPYTIELCSGVQDDDGVWMYDGDVVELIAPTEREYAEFDRIILEVKFTQGMFYFESGIGDNPNRIITSEESIAYDRDSWISMKVIGNIHQNKNLLTELNV